MKKLVALLLAFAMLLSLAACGGGEKAEDPNAGEYQGVSVSMMGIELGMDEVYPGENKLVLKSNGKLELILEGDKIPGSWKLDGETLDMTIEGEKCPGTLKNGVVVFDLAGSGVILTFAGTALPPVLPPRISLMNRNPRKKHRPQALWVCTWAPLTNMPISPSGWRIFMTAPIPSS